MRCADIDISLDKVGSCTSTIIGRSVAFCKIGSDGIVAD
jgi:hypothetical protein